MNHTKKMIDSVLAVLLSVMMIVAMLPIGTLEAFATTEDVFIFKVQDDSTTSISGATVEIYDSSLKETLMWSKTTNENGQVSFSEITELQSSEITEFSFYYVIKANGYSEVDGTITSSEDGWNGFKEVTLTPKAKATVSVTLTGDATVKLNGGEQKSITVNKGSNVSVEITPAEQSYIKELVIGSEIIPVSKGEAYCNEALTVESDINIVATVVKEKEYEVNVRKSPEGGKVLLNNKETNSLTAGEGSNISISVKADEGYQISSLKIGGEDCNISGNPSEYLKTISEISSNITVNVVFVKVYTVTINYDTNKGKVTVNGTENEGGSVIVKEGGSVIVKDGNYINVVAEPEENYRVSSVTVNDVADDGVTGSNNSGYKRRFYPNENYTIEITFALNVYNLSLGSIENGSVTIANSSVEYNGETRVDIKPKSGYTIDYIEVGGDSVETVNKDSNGAYFIIEGITEDKEVNVVFKKISKASKSDLNIDSSKAVKTDNNLFVLSANQTAEGRAIVFSTEKDGLRLYDSDNHLIGGGVGIKSVSVSDTITVAKVKLYYKADDEFYSEWHNVYDGRKLLSKKIVVDENSPVPNLTPDSEPNEDGYYNDDVAFRVSVNDDYSGIRKIEYWITNPKQTDVEITPITIYEYNNGEVINEYNYEDYIVVNASQYNSEGIKVILRLTDIAGNEKRYEKVLNINSTKPTITVSMNGTKNPNALDGYYNSARIATIAISDRADTFSQENVLKGIEIKANGKDLRLEKSDITWVQDGDTYIGTLVFTEDAEYSWTISYANIAVSSPEDDMIVTNDEVITEGENVFNFTIDTAKPKNQKITYSTAVLDTILETISFGFYRAPVTVTIEATDETSGIQQFTYSYTGSDEIVVESGDESFKCDDGKTARTSFKIPPEIADEDFDENSPQFHGQVTFSVMDKAGHTTTSLTDSKEIVVDSIAPDVNVEWNNTNPPKNSKYYNSAITAKIKIKEENFFKQDLDDGYLVITVEKTLNDGTYTKTNVKPEFTKDGEEYVANIEFNENADYTFDIKYTDRSGNVYDKYEKKEFTIDTISPEIEVSYDNNTALNSNHFAAGRVATIVVKEHNFSAENIIATVNANNNNVSEDYTEQLKNAIWTHEGDVHTAELNFDSDAHYIFSIDCTDLAGNPNETVSYNGTAPTEFIVDESDPEGLKISYSESILDTILDTILFGFYKEYATVTIEATDNTSGIDYFTYCYTVQGDESINSDVSDAEIIDESQINRVGNTATATFNIPAQFRGYISFTAYDNSGNFNTANGSKVVVVDNIKPVIAVNYNNNNFKNDKYFDANRTATIEIDEANLFEQDLYDFMPETDREYLMIIVGKTLDDGTYTETKVKPDFTKNGDKYTADIKFEDNADYTLDIKYTDRSNNEAVEYETDEFTVDKIQPELSITYNNMNPNNGSYYNLDRVATITVDEHNFRASDIEFDIEAKDFTGNTEIDLSSKNYEAYLQNQENWTRSGGDKWTANITLDIEGNYNIGMKYTDMAGNPQVEEIADSFCIDKSNPKPVSQTGITYSTSILDTVLEIITFGFYQAPVTVTIQATDEYAGIDYFTYSYTVEEDASTTNVGKSNVKVNNSDITYNGNKATATFEIPAQFRGYVSFTAYDNAGNSETFADTKAIVVDNVSPIINVTYDNNSSENGNYYKSDRTATIAITEANFFADDLNDCIPGTDKEYLVITVGKTLNDGTYTKTKVKPTFTKNGDVYTATVKFDENADYTFDIEYTDRSGNEAQDYEMAEFTIDKIKPVINVSYDNNNCKNNDQFNKNRTATITVKEHNFDVSDVVAKVTANGSVVNKYATYLKNEDNWIHNGDVHTAKISYTDEAHYTFNIAYTDMAGNVNADINYGESVATEKFTLDKTAPTDLTIKIDNVSVVGTNSIAFDKFYANKIAVKLSAKCDISGLQSLKYQKVSSVSDYNVNGNWTTYNDSNGIVISPSERFIIYFRAEDRAGNVSIINSTGIIVDNQKPIGEVEAPEIDILPESANANGVYNGNVNVNLKVVDPKYTGDTMSTNGYYSGLKKITYRVYTTDTNVIEEGTLFDLAGNTTGAVFDSNKLVSSWSGKINIDSTKFNSNNVIVEVTATDNAGNTRTSSTIEGEIKIDITAPEINISYSNNNAINDSYFNADRIATVVVTERNFNQDDVKFTLENTDNIKPIVSSWTRSGGSGNEDDTKWTATVRYTADGDYTFGIKYTDLAGNECTSVQYGNSVAPTKFTIDKTVPTVSVTYNNNDATNSNYYNKARTATIVITEHNLYPNGVDKDRINITMTATDDGAKTTVPNVSSWSTSGDRHTATIVYSDDALYTFDISVKDRADNSSADFAKQTFYVDKTAPTLKISGVSNNSANKGDVIPVVSYSDTNYDPDKVKITLTGANRKNVELDGSYANIHNGCIFTFRNFAKEKEIDDIYKLTATLTDKAGNTTTKEINFSVNRFGSTYALSKLVEEINGSYVKDPIDLVITETNPNKLKNIKITLFKNNETIILTEGTDYKIDVEGEDGSWYRYTYTIFKKNFEDDGVYRVSVHSEDSAGNVAENTLDTKDTEVSFGIDKTKPTLVVTNLESGITYALDNLTVLMNASDNLLLDSVTVYLDDYNNAYKTWTAEEIAQIIAENGEFTFNIPGDSTSAHKVKIVCVDAAGNEHTEEIVDFFVTTNLFVRFLNNKPLFFGSIIGVILLVTIIVFIVVHKKRKEQR